MWLRGGARDGALLHSLSVREESVFVGWAVKAAEIWDYWSLVIDVEVSWVTTCALLKGCLFGNGRWTE
jgi:hypothetical protein